MTYQLGNGELADQIDALIEAASGNANVDLIREMLVTTLKLHRDGADRADLLQFNTALKELRYANLVLSQHRDEPKVTIFGSARVGPDDPNYALAKTFAAAMADLGWGVITGAGPGIMAAGNEGAGLDKSYGIKIRLPFESEPNEFVLPNRVINYKYFFTRKLGLVKEAHGFAIFPGGFGTMDEAFEFLTLVQTGKSDMHPIVLIEAPGGTYWRGFEAFIRENLQAAGMVRPEDLRLFTITHAADEAVAEICGFYRNYQSQRYVDGRLILRLRTAPTDDQLLEINDEFGAILSEGSIERIEPTDQEVTEDDDVDLARVALAFDRRQFSQLRLLIDRLNSLVDHLETPFPPGPFTEEQQARPW